MLMNLSGKISHGRNPLKNMNKNLKESWKNSLVKLNILTIFLYAIGFFYSQKTDFDWLLQLMGAFYLLILTPLNLLTLFKIRLNHWLEWLLASISLYFTGIVPFFFIANYFFHLPFSWIFIGFFNLSLSLLVIILFFSFSNFSRLINQISFKTFPQIIRRAVLKYWPLIIALLLYAWLHLLNYHFYIFMPEWDGYTQLIEIKNVLKNNILLIPYRGFFTVATVLLTRWAQIPPYTVFTFLFVALQASLIIVIFLLLKMTAIKKPWLQLIFLLSALAVPVINLEIDAVRPQNIFLILLPVYFYFLLRALTTRRKTYWILSTLIAWGSLNYHEFFIFIFLLHNFTLILLFFQRYYLKAEDKRDRLIFYLLLLVFLLLALLSREYFPFLNYFILVAKKIAAQIVQTEKWRWWFLNNYSGDYSQQPLGWPGIWGALKYYAYYASPLVLFSFFLLLLESVRQKKIPFLLLPATFLVFLLLIYAELLPRLNYTYLPERVWVIIDILMILSLPLLFVYLPPKSFWKKTFPFLLASLSLIGLMGTVYVAKNKKSLISQNEFHAAQWIKTYTPPETIFISQTANGPLIKYFAQRQMVAFPPDFTQNYTLDNRKINPDFLQKNLLANIEHLLHQQKIKSLDDLNFVIRYLKENRQRLVRLQQKTKTSFFSSDSPLYILYSLDKFKTLYSQREWWLKANYYNLDINKLTEKYPLVYNKNGIYIWRVK